MTERSVWWTWLMGVPSHLRPLNCWWSIKACFRWMTTASLACILCWNHTLSLLGLLQQHYAAVTEIYFSCSALGFELDKQIPGSLLYRLSCRWLMSYNFPPFFTICLCISLTMHACLCTYTNLYTDFLLPSHKVVKAHTENQWSSSWQINWTGNELGEDNTTIHGQHVSFITRVLPIEGKAMKRIAFASLS